MPKKHGKKLSTLKNPAQNIEVTSSLPGQENLALTLGNPTQGIEVGLANLARTLRNLAPTLRNPAQKINVALRNLALTLRNPAWNIEVGLPRQRTCHFNVPNRICKVPGQNPVTSMFRQDLLPIRMDFRVNPKFATSKTKKKNVIVALSTTG